MKTKQIKRGSSRGRLSARKFVIPPLAKSAELRFGDRKIQLTNLNKLFWADPKITKRDLLQYYIDVSPMLLPHLRDRAMVLKRYPQGANGDFFFMKRAPSPRPDWIELCR